MFFCVVCEVEQTTFDGKIRALGQVVKSVDIHIGRHG